MVAKICHAQSYNRHICENGGIARTFTHAKIFTVLWQNLLQNRDRKKKGGEPKNCFIHITLQKVLHKCRSYEIWEIVKRTTFKLWWRIVNIWVYQVWFMKTCLAEKVRFFTSKSLAYVMIANSRHGRIGHQYKGLPCLRFNTQSGLFWVCQVWLMENMPGWGKWDFSQVNP